MNIDIDKALEISGNNNKYQITLLIVACLSWFSADFIALNSALLIFFPAKMECLDIKLNSYVSCDESNCCNSNFSNIDPTVVFNNVISDRNLYCEGTIVKCIIIVFTIGIVIGAYLASKYTDIYGRKFYALISLIVFTIFTATFALIPSNAMMLTSLFFMGIGSSGGTMACFVLVYEVVGTEKRNIYGVLINSSYGLAGLSYYFLFNMTKEWKMMCVLSVGCGIIACFCLIFFFAESPRYLISANKKKECLKALLKIANRNGRKNHYMQYLKEEVFTTGQLRSLGEEVISKSNFKYKEIRDIINNLDYSQDSSERQTPVLKAKHPDYTVFQQETNNMRQSSLNDMNNSIDDSKISPDTTINKSSNVLKNNSSTSSYQLRKNIRQSREFVREDDELEKAIDGEGDEPILDTNSIDIIYNKNDPGYAALCKYPSIAKTFLNLSINWAMVSFVYFGNSYDQKKYEPNQVFANGYTMFTAEFISYFLAGAIMEIPFMGRTRTIGYSGFLVCIFGLLCFFFVDNTYIGKPILFVFRFCVTTMFTGMYTYSTEVYPTSIRSKGLGINLTIARLSTIVIALTIQYYNAYIVFSIMGLCTFFSHFMMKETMGKPLLEQIEEITAEKDQLLSAIDSNKDASSSNNSSSKKIDN